MKQYFAVILALVGGLLIGTQLVSGPEDERITVPSQKKQSVKKENQSSELGLEGVYAELKEPVLLNQEIPAVQKAVMIYDIETREAYDRVIDDKEDQMQPELVIEAPLARQVLELYLQKNPKDVVARALLVKYLVFASHKGSGVFEETDLQRALTETKIAAKVKTQQSRAEMLRLHTELAGFLDVCPSSYAKDLQEYLDRASR